MSKKKNHRSITIDPKIIWNAHKPRYNAYQIGYGAHSKNKYSRKKKYKTDWRNYDRD